MDQLYALICEGPCNPNLKAIDAIVDEWVTKNFVDGVNPRVTDRELTLQRTLVHTPHIVRGEDAHCTQCFTHRAYGKTA